MIHLVTMAIADRKQVVTCAIFAGSRDGTLNLRRSPRQHNAEDTEPTFGFDEGLTCNGVRWRPLAKEARVACLSAAVA